MPVSNPENTAATMAGYPSKYSPGKIDERSLLIKTLYSIVLYIGLGYLLLRRWDLLLVIFSVVLLHEAGHFVAMKYYRYADVGIFFLPLMGALVKGSKKEISQRQSCVILLAGPLPGMLLGIILYFTDAAHPGIFRGTVPLPFIAQLLLWANLVNLLPIYPLDGGQLLNRVFLNEEGVSSNIFLFLSAAVTAWISVSSGFYILLIFPAFLLYRFFSTKNNSRLEKAIEQSGVDTNKTYEELSDEDYWKIRAVIIQHTPAFQHIPPGPPYHYDVREDKIATEIENALSRNLLMDISVTGKLIVILIWVLFIALPWLLDIPFLPIKYLVR